MNLKTFTVAAWIKFRNDTDGGEQNIAYKQVGDDRATRNYTLKMWGGKIYGIFASGGNTDAVELESATNVVDEKWHHVALTYDKKAYGYMSMVKKRDPAISRKTPKRAMHRSASVTVLTDLLMNSRF